MTTITFFKDDSDNFIGFEANGHAGYSKSGKDIVCSAISAITLNLVNSVDELTEARYSFEQNAITGYMKLLIEDNNSADVQLLFKSSQLGLISIQEDYSKYLKLTNRRY